MTAVLLVALGGAVGAPLRWVVDRRLARRDPDAFPRGTFVVNAVGSFVLGLLLGLAVSVPLPQQVLLLGGTGLCGALTTYSTFACETVRLVEQGHVVRAGLNVVASVAVTVGLGAVGVALGGAW